MNVGANSFDQTKPYAPRKRMPLWLVALLTLCGVGILLALSFVGVVYYSATYGGQTRSNPAFQGFHGYWDRDRDVEPSGEHWRLDLSRANRWKITFWQNDEDTVVDEGTWRELPGGEFELKSKTQTRIAKFEPGDEWVLYIDGVKYRRVVK